MSPADELQALRAQLEQRIREAYAGRSHAPVVIEQLGGFTERLSTLAEACEADIRGERAEIDRCIDAMTGVGTPVGTAAGEPPSFGELEAALCSWLTRNWRCTPLRIIETDRPSPAVTDGDTHDCFMIAWVLTDRDAHPVTVHVSFTRTAAGWTSVQRLAVAS